MTFFIVNVINAQSNQNRIYSYNDNIHLYNEGKNFYNSGEYDQAVIKFNKIIDQDPYFFNAYFKKSYAYYHEKKYKLALNEIEKGYNINNINNKYFYLKGQFYDKLKEYELAGYYLDLAINFNKNNYYYYNYRGGLHLELGNYQKAINDFNIVLHENPELYNVYFNRGIAKYNLKMKKEACLDWLYAKDENEACNRYFFYKCTKENLEGIKEDKYQHFEISHPVFNNLDHTSFSTFIAKNLIYPTISLHREEQGMVLIKFTLTTNLKIENMHILHSVSDSIDNEALKAVKKSEEYWNAPANYLGKPVDVEIIVPISFIIEENEIDKNYLLDSLNKNFEQNNYEKVISISSKILKKNPFFYEVYDKRAVAFEKLNLTDNRYNIEWFDDLRSYKSLYFHEIRSFNKTFKIYFNDLWEITDKAHATYYRLTKWSDISNFFEGEYIDCTIGGKLFSTGKYNYNAKTGRFKIYYSNGKLKQELNFFHNDNDSIWSCYYKNGTLKNKIDVSDFEFKILEYNDSSGLPLVKEGNGMFEHKYLNYLGTDTVKITGEIKDYEKNDIWKLYINDELIAFDEYKNGKFLHGLYLENGEKTKVKQPVIGTWLFIPNEILRAEELNIDLNVLGNSYHKFLYRNKKLYLNPSEY